MTFFRSPILFSKKKKFPSRSKTIRTKISNYELYFKWRHCHNLVLIYDTRMCFAQFWPFYLRHQQCYISDMHPGYVQWKKNTGFTQTSYSLYLISIYFDYLLGLNKIPCLLYEQLFIYTTIWLKRNILLGSILSLSYYLLC